MKKWLTGLFLFCLVLYNGGAALAEEILETAVGGTSARAAYIMDLRTGRTLFSWNEQERLPEASTTKVMTALLALEYGRLDEMVTTSRNAYGVPGTSIYLSLGEQLTLEHMLYGLMLASGNDAAVAIAEHVGGSLEGFLDQMNARALAMGLTNTHFTTPHGLPASDHYTSAYDLTQIAAQAMRFPFFRELVSTQRAGIPWPGREYDRVLRNKNSLLSTYAGATGIKTGFTRAAGRCLVFGAKRGDLELIGVVLNCANWFDEAARLMDRCFENYTVLEMLSDGDRVRSVPLTGGSSPTLSVKVQGNLSAPFALNETPRVTLILPASVKAPVERDTQLGWVQLYVGDTLVDQRPLVAAEDEASRSLKGAFQRILERWLLLSPTA